MNDTTKRATRTPARLVGAAGGYAVHADANQYIVTYGNRTVGYFGSFAATLQCIVGDSARRNIEVPGLAGAAEAVAQILSEALKVCRQIADGRVP